MRLRVAIALSCQKCGLNQFNLNCIYRIS
jgi:hypothetical protein